MKSRAVFLDRDGVINKLVYYPDHGIIDAPFTVAQFELLPGVPEAIRVFKKTGYKVIIISNQPGIAKGHMTLDVFEQIRQHMVSELALNGAVLDAEYYCFHHPDALLNKWKTDCGCRKPKPGLLVRASIEMDIDLSSSWMIGDGLTDIQSGRLAGCHTILMGQRKCELCSYMDEQKVCPDAISAGLLQTSDFIVNAVEGLERNHMSCLTLCGKP